MTFVESIMNNDITYNRATPPLKPWQRELDLPQDKDSDLGQRQSGNDNADEMAFRKLIRPDSAISNQPMGTPAAIVNQALQAETKIQNKSPNKTATEQSAQNTVVSPREERLKNQTHVSAIMQQAARSGNSDMLLKAILVLNDMSRPVDIKAARATR
jgi:hypothetical protein